LCFLEHAQSQRLVGLVVNALKSPDACTNACLCTWRADSMCSECYIGRLPRTKCAGYCELVSSHHEFRTQRHALVTYLSAAALTTGIGSCSTWSHVHCLQRMRACLQRLTDVLGLLGSTSANCWWTLHQAGACTPAAGRSKDTGATSMSDMC
jgi:hypothetical protein